MYIPHRAITRAAVVGLLTAVTTVANGHAAQPRLTTLHTGGGPTGLTTGAGAVWVADYAGRRVLRIDPRRRRVVARIALDGSPYAAAFGAGAVWISSYDQQHVWRIDPRTNRVVAAVDVGFAQQSGLTVANGVVWVAIFGSGKLVRIDSTQNTVSGTISVGGNPEDVVVTPDGIWVPNENGTVARLDPNALTPVASVRVGADPDYAILCRGRLWVSDLRGPSLAVIDLNTNAVVSRPRVGVGSAGFACGTSLWSVNYDNGALVELDPRNGRILSRRIVGRQLRAVVLLGRELWMCDQATGDVFRMRVGSRQ